MEKISKLTLVKEAAAESNLSAHDVNAALGAIVKCTQAHLKNGNEVIIPGIGILTIKDAKERMGKNPKTGEPIKIAASKRLGLKVSAEIKRMLNE